MKKKTATFGRGRVYIRLVACLIDLGTHYLSSVGCLSQPLSVLVIVVLLRFNCNILFSLFLENVSQISLVPCQLGIGPCYTA